ncbi:MAG: immune inhibitor A [Flavobacteriales bacterium]|nr:immune inhibitor A [Flavobacteriales bacterium]
MKKIFTLFLLMMSVTMFAQNSQYSKVKIFIEGHQDLYKLSNAGIAVDHGEYKTNTWFVSDFSKDEINTIQNLGYNIEILISDVQKYYATRPSTAKPKNSSCSGSTGGDYQTPSDFTLGSMGGFFTYAEFLGHIDNMSNKYPNLITVRQAIDTFKTHEGRDIFWLKISDNPNVDETEPEVFYSAIHHAREPAGLSQLIFYMYYLLENYNTDSEIKNLVDNTEMYFVPMINPDGYIRNETTNPNGGGMWRKNRRDNGDGTYGVDLNRNYAYQWGGQGASPSTNSDTYRGPSAFSEPETQAIKWFCEQHTFQLALNYHTFSDLLLYPYGYDYNKPTPDHGLFQVISELMVRENGYTNQISSDLYPAAGDSDDWMYGEQASKNKILAMTPEVGSSNDGFWPQTNDIIGLCKENVFANITMARLAGKHSEVTEKSDQLLGGLNNYATYDIQRLGLDSSGAFTVSLFPITSNIASVGSSNNHSNLPLLTPETDSISYILQGNIQSGDQVTFVLSVDNGSYVIHDTITKVYGNQVVIYADAANNFNNWTSNTWNVTTSDFVSSPSSITDSPNGNYQDQSTTIIESDTTLNLAGLVHANLEFWAKWEIEAGFDYVQLFASTDQLNWTPLCGKYTVLGNGNQAQGEPLYDGDQQNWVAEEVCLNDFLGQQIYLKFELHSDNFVNGDGFYFDDLTLVGIAGAPSSIEESVTKNISITPNPAGDYTFVNDLNGIQSIRILNSVGALVSIEKPTQITSSMKLNTSTLPDGIYYIQINGDKTQTQKLSIIH